MRINISFSKNLIVVFFSILLLFFIYLIQNHFLVICLVFFYSISVCFLYSTKSILDPRSLLLIMIAVYSMWFPIQILMFEYKGPLIIDMGVLLDSIKLQIFGIVVFVLVCTLLISEDRVSETRRLFFVHLSERRKEYLSEKVVFWSVFILVVFSLVVTATAGHTTKREILDSGSVLKDVSEIFFYLLLVVVLLSFLKSGKSVVNNKVLMVVFVGLGYFLILGERDVFFRVVVLVFLMVVDRKNIPVFFGVCFIVFSAVLIVPLSQGLKAVLLSGEININRQGLELVFSNEFTSAGRNLYSLMYYGVENSFSFLFNDVLRGFMPSILLPGFDIRSTGSWFNSVYRVENGFSGTSGWGFTLMGQGYLISGYFGVLVVMTIAAVIVSLLYRNSYGSEYWYVFYLMTLVTYVYVIRADLANLLAQVFKIGGLAIFTVYLFHCFLCFLKKEE